MIKLIRSLLVVLAACAPIVVAYAQAETRLAGTWVIDIPASEESMLRARPFKDPNAFIGMPYLGMLFHQFEGEKLTIGSLPTIPGEKTLEYRRTDLTGVEMAYTSTDGKKDAVTIVFLNDKNISITYPTMPQTKFLVWKRVILDPGKKVPSDYRPEFEAYMAFLVRLSKAFGFEK